MAALRLAAGAALVLLAVTGLNLSRDLPYASLLLFALFVVLLALLVLFRNLFHAAAWQHSRYRWLAVTVLIAGASPLSLLSQVGAAPFCWGAAVGTTVYLLLDRTLGSQLLVTDVRHLAQHVYLLLDRTLGPQAPGRLRLALSLTMALAAGFVLVRAGMVPSGVGTFLGVAAYCVFHRPQRRGAAQFGHFTLGPKAQPVVPALRKQLLKRGAYTFRQISPTKRFAELDDRAALPVLLAALGGDEISVRYSAAEVLGRMGQAPSEAIGVLSRLVGFDPLLGDRAAEALARIGPAGIAALAELVRDGHDAARPAAAGALGLVGGRDPVAMSALAAALDDKLSVVRRRAATALAQFESPSPELIEALDRCCSDPEPLVRLAASRSRTRLLMQAAFTAQVVLQE